MAYAQNGDKVTFHYRATLDDGAVFESTYDDPCEADDCDCEEANGPMELTLGSGEFFPEIEQALIGMAVDEKKQVIISCENAFGEYDQDKVFLAKRSELPEQMDPQIGDSFTLANDDEEIDVTVVETSDDDVTFDANHPLAGETLNFDIELIKII